MSIHHTRGATVELFQNGAFSGNRVYVSPQGVGRNARVNFFFFNTIFTLENSTDLKLDAFVSALLNNELQQL